MIEAHVLAFVLAVVAHTTDALPPAPNIARAGPRLVLAGAVVVSMRDGDDDDRRTVIVQGERITSIIDPTRYRFERGDVLIRAEGLWLMPGLNVVDVDTDDPVTLRRLTLRGVTAVGLADTAALTAMAPLAARIDARLPTLRQSPTASTLAQPSAEAEIAAPPDALASVLRTASFVDATQALRHLTRDAALALGRPDAGVVAAGFVADLVLLEADPRNDLSALRSIRAVVLRGQLITRAEIEATEDLIAERSESATHPFRGAAPVPEWPDVGWRRSFLLRLDGLSCGAMRSQIRSIADGVESHVQTVLWSPLHSTTTITACHDRLGRVVTATVRHDSPADALAARLEHIGDGWRIEVAIDGVERSFLIDGDLGASETVLLDLLPTVPDLRRVALHLDQPLTIDAAEFAYGPTTTTWGAITLGTAGARPPPGRDVFELAVGTRVPPDGSLATVWTAIRQKGVPMLATDGARRTALSVNRAVVGFDALGWPIAAVVVVPEGLWEVHPWDAPKSVPDASPRGNDVGSP